MKDLYEILGVSKDATKKEIQKAYRELSKKHHPDIGGDENLFKDIAQAYSILSNDIKRERYDKTGDVKEPNTDARLLDILNQLFTQAVYKEAHNPLEEVQSRIQGEIYNFDERMRDCNERKKLLNKTLKRLSCKKGEKNILKQIIELNIDLNNKEIGILKEELTFFKDIKKHLKNYTFKEDKDTINKWASTEPTNVGIW